MKNTIIAFVLASSTVTAVASDTTSIPSRSTPLAPLAREAPTANFWVGLNTGGNVADGINVNTPWAVGAVAGYNVLGVGPVVLGVEGTYDYKKGNTHDVVGNVIASVPFGKITPYVLVGAGYRWDNLKNEKIWNVGGGLKYAVYRNIEVDARYRRVEDWDRASHDDRATLGVNFKF